MIKEALSRRDFLFYTGATVAGVTLGDLGRRHLARADERAGLWHDPGRERWATSVCRECPAGCGVRVRLIDDVPVKLDGNPLCPISRGRLCARGQAALEAYFDPDRLVGPARRGAGEEGAWESIAWEPATTMLAGAIRRHAGEPGAILALGAEEHGPIADAWTRFWTAAGATVIHTPAAQPARLRTVFEALTGVPADPLFDLERATYVLSFGAPIVEDWLSPVWAQRAYGRFRRSESRSRGRLVQIDGRHSLTARKADEWIVVASDGQVALTYGIISVLLREGRASASFLDAYRGNLSAFEAAVVQRYTPDALAAATGVPVVTMLRFARELTSSAQPLAVVAADAEPRLAEAVFALNALIGALDRPGGVFAAQAVLADKPAPLPPPVLGAADKPRLVALRDPSALRSTALPFDVSAAIARAELVVSFSPYMDEAAANAHLLMPVHTPLESWHALIPPRAVPGDQVAVARPAVEPRLDTRDLPQALRIIGEAVGGPMAGACRWQSSADLAGEIVNRLAQERRGAPYCSEYETEWIAQLERGGWWTSAAPSNEFGEAVLRAGGWCDPFFEPGYIRQTLSGRGGLTFPDPPMPAAPVDPDFAAGPEQFPLRVFPFTPALVSLAGSPNQPSLLELLGPPQRHPWQVWMELSPETAESLHVPDGARVRLSSAHGSLEAIAVLVERMPAGVAAVALLPCVPEAGRWANGLSADARRLWPRDRPPTGPIHARVARA